MTITFKDYIMNELTASGQIEVGATIVLAYRKEGQVHRVCGVLNAGTDTEEILLDRELNLYFITISNPRNILQD